MVHSQLAFSDEGEQQAWLAGRRLHVVVKGWSMWPALASGDEVLVAPERVVSVGDIVVARHPSRTDVHWVKRVLTLADGRADLRSDNPTAGTDSRTQGLVPVELILGPVTSRCHLAERRNP